MSPCNCGKKTTTPPAGSKPKAPDLERRVNAPNQAVRETPKPPLGSTKHLTGQRQTFSLMVPEGRVQTFGSRLEAEAARVRAGGVGTITP